MKQLFGQVVFMSLVAFAVFGNQLNVWVGYAENIITFFNIIMFFVMIGSVIGSLNIDEILKKSPPKQLLAPLYVNWSIAYYFIVVLSFIMAGWFFTAIIWAILGLTNIAMMYDTNEAYVKAHPNEVDDIQKSKLQEMADGDE